MEIFERNIAEEWYQYGLKSGDDIFMRFMMHWMLFLLSHWLILVPLPGTFSYISSCATFTKKESVKISPQ